MNHVIEAERAEVRAALQAWAEREGREPTYRAWRVRPEGMPGRSKILRLWGGNWRDAMIGCGFSGKRPGEYARPAIDREAPCGNAACGQPVGSDGVRGRCRRCYEHLRKNGVERDPLWKHKALAERRRHIAAQARVLAERLGRAPTSMDWGEWEERPCAVVTVFRNFPGGWREMLDMAGLKLDSAWHRAHGLTA